MGKKRKLKTGYDREVTESPIGFTWTVGQWMFLWRAGPGLNTSIHTEAGWQPCVYSTSLKEAGSFAEGFVAGSEAAWKGVLPSPKGE